MDNNSTKDFFSRSTAEIDFKGLFSKVWKNKWWFALSLAVCLLVGYVVIKVTPPTYKVTSTILIDSEGATRKLGSSELVGGDIGLIETEKNLYNEMAVIKSFSLVEKAIQQLDFGISYHAQDWLRAEEFYRGFPFEIELVDSSKQMLNVPIEIEILSDDKFRLTIDTKEFNLYDPKEQIRFPVKTSVNFSQDFFFDQTIQTDYFHFRVKTSEESFLSNALEGKSLFFKIHDVQGLANGYLQKVNVNQYDIEASVLELETTGMVPEKEVLFLNELTKQYINSKLEERDEIALKKVEFLRSELANVSDSLRRAEANLEFFRRSSNAIDLSQSGINALNRANDLNFDKRSIETNIQYYQSQLSALDNDESVDNLVSPPVGIDDPLLNESLSELKRLYNQRERDMLIKGEKSKEMEILNNQIAQTRGSIKESLRSHLASAQMSLNRTNSMLTDMETTINRMPSDERRLLRYERESSRFENMYNYLGQELAKARMAQNENIPDAKVLDSPRIKGDGPVSPKKSLIMILAGLVGMLVPFIGILLFDNSTEEIVNKKQIESYTNIPVLASIPHQKSPTYLFSHDPEQWDINESFRDLAANLQFLIPDNGGHTIGMISTLPGEGKTFCASNLAVHASLSGLKVLLIDSDLRVPSLLKDELKEGQNGLSDYLKDYSLSISDVIRNVDGYENLDFIPTQIESGNPQQLLTSVRFEEMMTKLKDSYDYVIFDFPAIGMVSDYLLLARSIDTHLFVVRRNLSQLSFIKDLERLKRKGVTPNPYIVFNDVSRKSHKYGYGAYYYDKEGQAALHAKSKMKILKARI